MKKKKKRKKGKSPYKVKPFLAYFNATVHSDIPQSGNYSTSKWAKQLDSRSQFNGRTRLAIKTLVELN